MSAKQTSMTSGLKTIQAFLEQELEHS